jgi:Mannosyl-glycoprotein endo-beta-N-acetylglucosaminidase
MRKLVPIAVLYTALLVLHISATGPDLPKKNLNTLSVNHEYIQRFKDLALLQQYTTGIPASIKLGQALLESKAGESELAINANNHFGLKCRNCADDEAYMKTDDEYDKKTGALLYSKFQRFNTPEDSYSAHSRRLTTESRYYPLFNNERTDYRAWARGLQKCGYATDPNYAERLIAIIETYNLQRFDKPSLLSIPEIGGQVPPQYAAGQTAINVPYDSHPNAAIPQSGLEKQQIDAPTSLRQSGKMSKKTAQNYCTESQHISKDGEQVEFTLYEVTLAEEVTAKNSMSTPQKAVLSQPVQRKKQK